MSVLDTITNDKHRLSSLNLSPVCHMHTVIVSTSQAMVRNRRSHSYKNFSAEPGTQSLARRPWHADPGTQEAHTGSRLSLMPLGTGRVCAVWCVFPPVGTHACAILPAPHPAGPLPSPTNGLCGQVALRSALTSFLSYCKTLCAPRLNRLGTKHFKCVLN